MGRYATTAAALILGVAAVTATAQPVRESPARVADDSPRYGADDSQRRYAAVTAWCASRFPYRDDLQEACQWGAYEMLPAQEVRETRETREEVIAWPRV